MLCMFYFVNCRMFKSLSALVIGSFMAMSAESLRLEAPKRIPLVNIDNEDVWRIYWHYTEDKDTVRVVDNRKNIAELSCKDDFMQSKDSTQLSCKDVFIQCKYSFDLDVKVFPCRVKIPLTQT